MPMNFAIADLKADLVRDEGLRLKVYDDATGHPIIPGYTCKGHPTVGIGRALDTNGVTVAEAETLAADDIAVAYAGLCSHLTWFPALDGVRQRVLINMSFEMGVAGVLNFGHMLAFIELKTYQQAADNMLLSTWAKQVPSRAQRLASAMRTGAF